MKRVISPLIIALGLLSLGLCIKEGIESFKSYDRVVTVKGLSEREYPADKVVWPLTYKEVGNDILQIYNSVAAKNQIVTNFLVSNGIDESEISVSAPEIIDMQAERYIDNNQKYRYNVTSVLTVASNKVDKVRELMTAQVDLLKEGVAITTNDYYHTIRYSFTKLNEVKPEMIEEATQNARASADKFAQDSNSKIGKIKTATQGQFSITDRDENTPHIKTVRVVTTVQYFIKD